MCIELKGLCLRKPSASSPERLEVKEERAWSSHHSPSSLSRTLPPAQAPPPRDRKFKVDPEVKPLPQKPEITKSWAREMLANGDAKRGRHNEGCSDFSVALSSVMVGFHCCCVHYRAVLCLVLRCPVFFFYTLNISPTTHLWFQHHHQRGIYALYGLAFNIDVLCDVTSSLC